MGFRRAQVHCAKRAKLWDGAPLQGSKAAHTKPQQDVLEANRPTRATFRPETGAKTLLLGRIFPKGADLDCSCGGLWQTFFAIDKRGKKGCCRIQNCSAFGKTVFFGASARRKIPASVFFHRMPKVESWCGTMRVLFTPFSVRGIDFLVIWGIIIDRIMRVSGVNFGGTVQTFRV